MLCAAFALAVFSMFFVPPDIEYIAYIDFRTPAILFSLMTAMAGLRKTGFFQWIAQSFLCRVKKTWQLVCILVLLCFFASMAVTNDVALITFVPFTFIVLDLIGADAKNRLTVPVVVLQTISANLGSMLTPIGNPQNLYLYSKAGLPLSFFLLRMLPYSPVSLLLLLICSTLCAKVYPASVQVVFAEKARFPQKAGPFAVYTTLFILDLLTVAKVIPCWLTFFLTILLLAVTDRSIFAQVDYSVLLTFVGFFIFVGNLRRLPLFYGLLREIVSGNELLTGVAASQVISNVPAALLLSEFTDNIPPLIVGVNIGGLCTLIASMASLIFYKLVIWENGGIKGRYFWSYIAANLCFLVTLLLCAFLVGHI